MMLAKKEIEQILSKYDLGCLIDFEQLEKGVANHNWLVKTNQGRFVLRCVSKWKKIRDVYFELKYLEYFRKRFSYDIPKAVKNLENSYVSKYKDRLFWIYPLIRGMPLEKYGKKELKEVASLMADYHKILVNSRLDNRKTRTLIINPSLLKELQKQRKNCLNKKRKQQNNLIYLSLVDDLIRIYKNLTSKGYFTLKTYPLHRDINPENIIFKDGKVVGLIDFDNVSFYKEPLIKDIVIFLMYSCRDKKNPQKLNLKLAKFFLNEYKKYRKLTINEIKFIPNLATSNAIEDFSYVQWLFEHEPKRAKLYRLKLYSEVSKWFQENKEIIIKELS